MINELVDLTGGMERGEIFHPSYFKELDKWTAKHVLQYLNSQYREKRVSTYKVTLRIVQVMKYNPIGTLLFLRSSNIAGNLKREDMVKVISFWIDENKLEEVDSFIRYRKMSNKTIDNTTIVHVFYNNENIVGKEHKFPTIKHKLNQSIYEEGFELDNRLYESLTKRRKKELERFMEVKSIPMPIENRENKSYFIGEFEINGETENNSLIKVDGIKLGSEEIVKLIQNPPDWLNVELFVRKLDKEVLIEVITNISEGKVDKKWIEQTGERKRETKKRLNH